MTEMEENNLTTALVPGSFKPPHRGHYAMIEYFSQLADKAIVVISDPQSAKSIRRTVGGLKITGHQAKEILDIYTAHLSNVEIIVSPQPVKWVYDYTAEDTTPGERVLLGVSGKGDDAKRYASASKYAPDGVTVEAHVFNDSDLNISASDFRSILDQPTIATIAPFVPDHVSDADREKVLQILSSLTERRTLNS